MTHAVEADVIVVGSGPAGLTAAIAARQAGLDVLVVEANFDVGGAAILSAGAILLGGGNPMQAQNGVVDDAERVFDDWTDWRHMRTRYNDRALVETYARHAVVTYNFLTACGVVFEQLNGPGGADSVAARPQVREWPDARGVVIPGQQGSGLTRPLEQYARGLGVAFLLQHRMTRLLAEGCGRIGGIEAQPVDRDFAPSGTSIQLNARRGVVLATGGMTGNVRFRTGFDPRLTEEYQQVGQSWSLRQADGHLAGLAVGAAICGTAGQSNETSAQLSKGRMGVRDNYHRIGFVPSSSCFFRAGATGHVIRDWQNAILVRDNGDRFWNEEAADRDYDYLAAAMSWNGNPDRPNGGGPIWCIMDQAGLEREALVPALPSVDTKGYFFAADSLPELAEKLGSNPYQFRPMPAARLVASVDRYNTLVRQGRDVDFGKSRMGFTIERGPFYAGWHTPCCHDTYVGLRTGTDCRVIRFDGSVIEGLFAAGECQGGFSQHGLGRAVVFGRLAGLAAAGC